MSYSTFVMVPVPEECVDDVVQLVARLNMQGGTERSLTPWDEPTMERYFLDADEEIRSLLSVVARGVLKGRQISDQIVADFMQMTPRDTLDVMRRVRDSVKGTGRPHLVGVEVVEVPTPTGRMRQKRVFTMQSKIARMVRSAERSVNALEQHPLNAGDDR